jgi:hypothetical protein
MQPCPSCHEYACNCDALKYSHMNEGHYQYRDPLETRARREAERLELKALAAKRARMLAALENIKPCAECERDVPHDPDDFLCIVCRDGDSAVPPGYAHYWLRN